MRLTMALAAGALLALSGVSRADWQADRQFIDQAASINRAEIQLGQLALQRGTTDEVRDYGRRMISDHQMAQEQLRRVARRARLPLWERILPQHQQDLNQLSQLYGQDFDVAYLEHMRTGHLQALQLFRDEAQYGSDPQLAWFARRQLPILQAHEHMAREELGEVHHRFGRPFPGPGLNRPPYRLPPNPQPDQAPPYAPQQPQYPQVPR